MNWWISHQADSRAVALADRHYSRKKPGSRQFMPPGRMLVLLSTDGLALWGTSWPYARYVNRPYPGAFLCSIFRNEGDVLSSVLALEAIAATRYHFGQIPADGFITFVDADAIASPNPGYCFKCAGFRHVGYTANGLHILRLAPRDMPAPAPPLGLLPLVFHNQKHTEGVNHECRNRTMREVFENTAGPDAACHA